MILSVLKVIGMILLIILLICILILGIILFVPIRYEFAVELDDGLNATGQVKWSPVLLTATANYEAGKIVYIVRMLGGVVMTNQDIPLSWIGRKFFSAEVNEISDKDNEILEKDNEISEKSNESTEKSFGSHLTQESEKTFVDKHMLKQQKVSNERLFVTKLYDKIKKAINHIKLRVKLFISRLKNINKKREELLKVYHSRRFNVAKKDVIQYVKEIFRIIKPKKAEGYIHFGMENPADTGHVLGVLALFIPWYDSFFQIQPDFEQKCLDGKINGKGRIYLFSVVKWVLKIMFNKNLIKVIKKVQTIIEA